VDKCEEGGRRKSSCPHCRENEGGGSRMSCSLLREGFALYIIASMNSEHSSLSMSTFVYLLRKEIRISLNRGKRGGEP